MSDTGVGLPVPDVAVGPLARILMKLRLRDRVQAVVFAYEHGIT